ncbi:alkane 1-monooxygenase [Panacagrimonas perspica]|uniref:Alkane 1-monooxygenase n=1 Tax=Panacagrimonas perspica TaxID=381431 RepID=A0A4V3F676_9GAMM|nr:alkane 1-monooxygenase [Panacagrimonas perspica]TDU31616.1 alkane 1-monooxygenase [Panacagrimonas perspica]THD03156.1 alkane 1-monooxygenase [Panacagrimonas perspica]
MSNSPAAAPAELTSYRDDKRHWWWLPLFVAISPVLGIYLTAVTDRPSWLWITPVLWYVVLPIADWLVGRDSRNPPDVAVPNLESDGYYKFLVYASIPLFYLTWLVGAWAVATQAYSWVGYLGVSLAVALTNGLALVVGHEIGHKTTRFEKRLAQIVLAVPAYGHFSAEHNRGHHKDVATPDDPASSRFGETLYGFVLREIPGALGRAWHDEKVRLHRQGKGAWSPSNELLQSFAITAVLYGTALALWGVVLIPFLLISTFWGWQFLSTSNYIEHYGLLRQKLPDGRFERCRAEHSWNADHAISNLMLYHLQRHSDHHARPTRCYQALRSDKAPELPSGYPLCFTLAYFPPLWRAVMDKRVLEVYGGDITRVNIQPSKRAEILAKYGAANISAVGA